MNELITNDSPAAMLRAAITGGADLDKLEKMLVLQERWEANEARKAYHAAMAAFKADPPEIEKDRKVSYGQGKTSYSHATLANVNDKISKALSQHGLSAAWKTSQDERGVTVTCTITHQLGHSESTSLTASPDNSGSKNSIQAVGSTITYLSRYTLLSLTGLATHEIEDDDGAGSSETITPEQVSELNAMIEQKRVDVAKFLGYMKVGKVDEILIKDFNRSLAVLRKAKGASDGNT